MSNQEMMTNWLRRPTRQLRRTEMWNDESSKGKANKLEGGMKPDATRIAGGQTKTDKEPNQAEGEKREQVVEVRRKARRDVEKAAEEVLRDKPSSE